jgi:hypothetical protein
MMPHHARQLTRRDIVTSVFPDFVRVVVDGDIEEVSRRLAGRRRRRTSCILLSEEADRNALE